MFLAWIPILWPVAVVVVEVVLRLVYQEGYSHSSHRGPFYFLIRNVLAGLVAAPLAERMAMKNYKIPKDNKS